MWLSNGVVDLADDTAKTACRRNTDTDDSVRIYIHKDIGKQNLMPPWSQERSKQNHSRENRSPFF